MFFLLVEENFIPLETQSQGIPPATPSDTDHIEKGKGNRNNTDTISPVHLISFVVPRTQKKDRKGLFRTRRPVLVQHDEWKDRQGDHIHTPFHLPIQQKPQTRGLDREGSRISAPPTLPIPISMEHGKQEFQPGFKLGRTWDRLPEDMSQRDIFQGPY
ncbi:hypothetical protein O181_066849 [Austropuccinia psidii MF-1]|uniref:Uncharacterized protein n=1 Tax=Austropuccinia psidii MF-1 TaxID=1389203 RepID=A0A9Q3EU87_9BASI|nr:hypothetical protein [Austropuccinia psidii MF-1]